MKGIRATNTLLLAFVAACFVAVQGKRGLRIDENQLPRDKDRELKGKGKGKSKSKSKSSSTGGTAPSPTPPLFPLVQNFLCEVFDTVTTAANNPLTDFTCRTNSCDAGCCRLVDRTFLSCDVRNLFPFSPCICNGNTGDRGDAGGEGVPILVFSAEPSGSPTKSPEPSMTPSASSQPTTTPFPTVSPTLVPTPMPVNLAIPGMDPAVQNQRARACVDGHPTWAISGGGGGLVRCRDARTCDGTGGQGECCTIDYCVCQPIGADRFNELCVPPPVNGQY